LWLFNANEHQHFAVLCHVLWNPQPSYSISLL